MTLEHFSPLDLTQVSSVSSLPSTMRLALPTELIVRATDCLTGARAEVDVEVTVLDVNQDNPPVFEMAFNTKL